MPQQLDIDTTVCDADGEEVRVAFTITHDMQFTSGLLSGPRPHYEWTEVRRMPHAPITFTVDATREVVLSPLWAPLDLVRAIDAWVEAHGVEAVMESMGGTLR